MGKTSKKRSGTMTWENFSKKPEIVPCVRDASGLVVALGVGYSDEELQKLCKKHQGWYLSYFRE